MKLDLDECNNPSKGSILFYQFKKQNVTKIAGLVDLFVQPIRSTHQSIAGLEHAPSFYDHLIVICQCLHN